MDADTSLGLKTRSGAPKAISTARHHRFKRSAILKLKGAWPHTKPMTHKTPTGAPPKMRRPAVLQRTISEYWTTTTNKIALQAFNPSGARHGGPRTLPDSCDVSTRWREKLPTGQIQKLPTGRGKKLPSYYIPGEPLLLVGRWAGKRTRWQSVSQ